jgi:hypothetical protein
MYNVHISQTTQIKVLLSTLSHLINPESLSKDLQHRKQQNHALHYIR